MDWDKIRNAFEKYEKLMKNFSMNEIIFVLILPVFVLFLWLLADMIRSYLETESFVDCVAMSFDNAKFEKDFRNCVDKINNSQNILIFKFGIIISLAYTQLLTLFGMYQHRKFKNSKN